MEHHHSLSKKCVHEPTTENLQRFLLLQRKLQEGKQLNQAAITSFQKKKKLSSGEDNVLRSRHRAHPNSSSLGPHKQVGTSTEVEHDEEFKKNLSVNDEVYALLRLDTARSSVNTPSWLELCNSRAKSTLQFLKPPENIDAESFRFAEAASEEYMKGLRRLYTSAKISELRSVDLQAARERVQNEELRIESKKNKRKARDKASKKRKCQEMTANQRFNLKLIKEYGKYI